jgi:TRAP-type C4-dicarboxylate transport system permease small subunit
VFFLEMIWSGFYAVGPTLAQTEAGLGISVAWFVAAIPAGFVLLTYHVLVLLAALWREPRSAEADESSATTSLT